MLQYNIVGNRKREAPIKICTCDYDVAGVGRSGPHAGYDTTAIE